MLKFIHLFLRLSQNYFFMKFVSFCVGLRFFSFLQTLQYNFFNSQTVVLSGFEKLIPFLLFDFHSQNIEIEINEELPILKSQP